MYGLKPVPFKLTHYQIGTVFALPEAVFAPMSLFEVDLRLP